jgi:hypothetical protein
MEKLIPRLFYSLIEYMLSENKDTVYFNVQFDDLAENVHIFVKICPQICIFSMTDFPHLRIELKVMRKIVASWPFQ